MNNLLKKALTPVFKTVARLPICNPHFCQEIEMMVAKTKPVCIIGAEELKDPSGDKSAVAQKMKDMVRSGEIVLIGEKRFEQFGMIQVYAQAHKIEDGKELFARYYNDGKGYPALTGADAFRRIGTLLGYSPRDTMIYKVSGGLTGALLNKTDKWRRKIRQEYGLDN